VKANDPFRDGTSDFFLTYFGNFCCAINKIAMKNFAITMKPFTQHATDRRICREANQPTVNENVNLAIGAGSGG